MAGKGLNRVQLIGNIGKDPDVRYTTSGLAVASFSVATNESWKDKEGNLQEKTEWHNIVAWQRLAEICGEYVKKGNKIYIEGKLQTRSYEDKEGVKRYTTEIVAQDVILLGSKQESRSPAPPPAEEEAPAKSGRTDDLPF